MKVKITQTISGVLDECLVGQIEEKNPVAISIDSKIEAAYVEKRVTSGKQPQWWFVELTPEEVEEARRQLDYATDRYDELASWDKEMRGTANAVRRKLAELAGMLRRTTGTQSNPVNS